MLLCCAWEWIKCSCVYWILRVIYLAHWIYIHYYIIIVWILRYHPRLNPSTLTITILPNQNPNTQNTINSYVLWNTPTRSCHFRSRFFSTPLTQNSPPHTITYEHHHLRLHISPAQIHINTKFRRRFGALNGRRTNGSDLGCRTEAVRDDMRRESKGRAFLGSRRRRP